MGLKNCTCPKCGEDVTDSYFEYDPDVGIMGSGWYCEKCDEGIPLEDNDYDDSWDYDD